MEQFGRWFGAPWQDVARVAVAGFTVYLAVLAYTRIVGLRSFAKMSSTDFAGTVAIGSAMASVVVSTSIPLSLGLVGIATFYAMPYGLAVLRRRRPTLAAHVENEPLLLMRDGEVLHDNCRRGNVNVADLRAKLRESNALRLADVRAVVLETTGDVSVLHGDTDIDPWIVEDVRGA